jgi:hypothetical protein
LTRSCLLAQPERVDEHAGDGQTGQRRAAEEPDDAGGKAAPCAKMQRVGGFGNALVERQLFAPHDLDDSLVAEIEHNGVGAFAHQQRLGLPHDNNAAWFALREADRTDPQIGKVLVDLCHEPIELRPAGLGRRKSCRRAGNGRGTAHLLREIPDAGHADQRDEP